VFLQLTSLMIPGFVAVILPITTFVVVQFIYQRLAGDRELTVMRAAGLSPWALARPALMLGVLVMALCYVFNLWIVPASMEDFRAYQFEIRNRVAAFLLQEGVFTPISDQLMVYVRSRDTDGTLHGILVEDERQTLRPAGCQRQYATCAAGTWIARGDRPKDRSPERADLRAGYG
jgi:lipopolysaccharide export system permease protein